MARYCLLLVALCALVAATSAQKPPYGCPAGCDSSCAAFNNNVLEKFFTIDKLACKDDSFCTKQFGSQATCYNVIKGNTYCWISTTVVCKNVKPAAAPAATPSSSSIACPPGVSGSTDTNVLLKTQTEAKLNCRDQPNYDTPYCKKAFGSLATCEQSGKYSKACYLSSTKVCPKGSATSG